MKVFVTGGTGFIGSHIVAELLAQGDEVTILARNPSKIPSFLDLPGVTVVPGGLDDFAAIRLGLAGCDACIHNAIWWDEEPTELELKDVLASVRVFEAAAEAGVSHLIYTSSTAVHRPFRPSMNEEQRLTPTDFYGATKAASEVFLSAFAYQTSMRCSVIRPGPTIGGAAVPGGPVKVDRRIQSMIDAASRDEDIWVAKHDGRQFIAAKDLAKVYSAILRNPGDSRFETYLAVAKDFVTWEDIALRIVASRASSSQVIVEDTGLSPTPDLFDAGKIDRMFSGMSSVLDCLGDSILTE